MADKAFPYERNDNFIARERVFESGGVVAQTLQADDGSPSQPHDARRRPGGTHRESVGVGQLADRLGHAYERHERLVCELVFELSRCVMSAEGNDLGQGRWSPAG